MKKYWCYIFPPISIALVLILVFFLATGLYPADVGEDSFIAKDENGSQFYKHEAMGDLFIYSPDDMAYRVLPYQDGVASDILIATVDSDFIYFVSESRTAGELSPFTDRNIYRYDKNLNTTTLLHSEELNSNIPIGIISSADGVFLTCSNSESNSSSLHEIIIEIDEENEGELIVTINEVFLNPDSAIHFNTLLSNSDDLSYLDGSANMVEIAHDDEKSTEVGLNLKMSFAQKTILYIGIFTAVLVAMLTILILIYTNSKRLWAQLSIVISLFGVLIVVAVGSMFVLESLTRYNTLLIAEAERLQTTFYFWQEAGSYINNELRNTFAIGLTGLVVIIIVAVSVTRTLTAPLTLMVEDMESIVYDGSPKGEVVLSRKNEIGDIWQTVQEMSVSLKIKKYESDTSINAYKRFVPSGLSKILSRASISEVSSGDMINVESNLALITVTSRDRVRLICDDFDFMSFVNDCFTHINNMVEKHNGTILSGDFKLQSLGIMFDSADDALAFALDVQHTENFMHKPEFSVVLHRGSFLYGIAGTEMRTSPFLSSRELDFLGSHSDKLCTEGVRLTMTEPMRDLISNSNSKFRYIGYICEPDTVNKSCSHKLYQILDCLPEKEKFAIISYDDKMQQAIDLFYKSDFYFARNIFSSLLRVNPNDNIAKWYIFSCESFLDLGVSAEVSHTLF